MSLVVNTNIVNQQDGYLLDASAVKVSEGTMLPAALSGKQDSISDLATIRSGAAAGATAAQKSSTVSATLLAASWAGSSAPYTYTLSVSGVTASSNQEFLPAVSITSAQLSALQAANLQDGGQAAGSITLKAYGTKPTVDLPIRVLVRGD